VGPLPLLLLLTSTARADLPVVVLDLGEAAMEDRFHVELALLLGGDLAIEPVGAESLQLGDGDWLDALRPVIPAGHAVVWLDPAAERCRASVAVFNATRAEVQVVEVPPGEGAEALLALSVREVLSTAGAESPPPPPEPTPPPPESVPPRNEPVNPAHPRVGATATTPMNGAVRGGAIVQTDWTLQPGLSAGLRLDIQAGAHGLWLQPGVQVTRGRWVVGTHAAVVRHAWGYMVRPGARLGMLVPLSEEHIPGVSLTWLPVRDIVHRDRSILYDSGVLELTLEYTWGRARD